LKKRILSLAAALLLLLAVLPVPARAADNGTITVYNWGQYIADGTDGSLDVLAEFTKRTGIKVNYLTFDSNESMYTKLKTGGSTYDIIIPSDYMIGKLISEDMLEKIDFANVPNYKNVDDAFRNTAYDPDNAYSVPYTWGTTGLIYNTKYVDPVTSWKALWDKRYSGKILMFDNCRDAFGIAELIQGYSLNTEDPDEYRSVAYLLMQQKPLVQSYVMDQIFDKMERGEAWLAPYYAGDYLTMAEENPDLAFCLPDEGYNLFIDAMCIPKGCTNKAGAEAFINFMCDPEISGKNLDYLGYSTPISSAKQYMDPDMASSPVAYPDAATLARGLSYSNLSTQASQQMDSLWLSVKTSGSDTTRYLITSGIVIAVIVLLAVLLRVRSSRRKARRCRKWRETE